MSYERDMLNQAAQGKTAQYGVLPGAETPLKRMLQSISLHLAGNGFVIYPQFNYGGAQDKVRVALSWKQASEIIADMLAENLEAQKKD